MSRFVSRFVRTRFLFLPAFAAVFAMPALAHAQAAPAVPKNPAAAVIPQPARTAVPSEAASTQSITFSLRFIKPSELVSQLVPFASADEKPARFALPPGLVRVSPDDTTRRVFVQGTPDAVQQVQTLARLLDVEPRTARLVLRILRGPINALVMLDDKFVPSDSSVVTTLGGTGGNNQPLTLHAIGDGQLFRVLVTPHINGDNTVTLTASLSEISALSKTTSPITDKQTRQWTRRIASGTRVVTASVTSPEAKDMAYYLEITPLVNTPPAAAKNAP